MDGEWYLSQRYCNGPHRPIHPLRLEAKAWETSVPAIPIPILRCCAHRVLRLRPASRVAAVGPVGRKRPYFLDYFSSFPHLSPSPRDHGHFLMIQLS